MASLTSLLSGVAGEYFVAAELSRRGYVASITLRNTRGIDILASNADGTQTVGIQVKTAKAKGARWMLNSKAQELPESSVAKNLFYVFVSLNDGESPSYHIVPREVVAAFVRSNHEKWLATPGRRNQEHKDNPVRTFLDTNGEYRDAWGLLGLD